MGLLKSISLDNGRLLLSNLVLKRLGSIVSHTSDLAVVFLELLFERHPVLSLFQISLQHLLDGSLLLGLHYLDLVELFFKSWLLILATDHFHKFLHTVDSFLHVLLGVLVNSLEVASALLEDRVNNRSLLLRFKLGFSNTLRLFLLELLHKSLGFLDVEEGVQDLVRCGSILVEDDQGRSLLRLKRHEHRMLSDDEVADISSLARDQIRHVHALVDHVFHPREDHVDDTASLLSLSSREVLSTDRAMKHFVGGRSILVEL